MINDLKTALINITTRKELKAVSIYYDVVTSDPDTDSQTDAIAALVEHLESDAGYIFYYPYEIKDDQLVFGNSFGEEVSKEVLIRNINQ